MSAKEDIEAVRDRFARLFNAGKIDELGESFYAEDAYALPPDHEPIRGRRQIARYIRELRESGDVNLALGILETVAEGESGYVVGTYVMTSGGQRVKGVTHESFRRQADGTWKCVVDMWHNSAPA
jgi:ketosteroid isomerase-like protein